MLAESVPEGGPLATVIGVAQMIGSASRTVAPAFASSLFSLTLEGNLASGNLVYYVLLVMTVAGIGSSFSLVSSDTTAHENGSLSI